MKQKAQETLDLLTQWNTVEFARLQLGGAISSYSNIALSTRNMYNRDTYRRDIDPDPPISAQLSIAWNEARLVGQV